MEITNVDLKILIKEFLTASSRMLRAGFEIYSDELSKFINFLETHPLIWNYIESCGEPEFDVEKEACKISSSYGRMIFYLGSTNEREVSNIYGVIKYLADTKYSGNNPLFFGYSSSIKFQDNVNGFGDKYIRILINHIENYLSTLAIKMGMDSKMTMHLEIKDSNLTNTQLTLAGDGASIVATQTYENYGKLDELVKSLLATTVSLNSEEKTMVSECIEIIETIKEEKPKKSIIKMAITTLQGIAGTTEFAAAVATLVQFVQSLL